MKKPIMRGDIYYTDPEPAIGSEQGGFRPSLIISNDMGNRYSSTVIIAPITSQIGNKPNLPSHTTIKNSSSLDKDSIILFEQIRTIDKCRLGNYIGRLEQQYTSKINDAISISLGIMKPLFRKSSIYLCRTCASNLLDSGSLFLCKATQQQQIKHICSVCNQSPGYKYETISRQ